ncbi:hypothetical protein [Rufibacter immobilis]|uniref:hypothetical protein n=1 Tax=Rufibacter immobilis TaxID=1348778 RepID=UPI0011CEC2C3|nr:hypothetical protein [Rufibacter immobilis]
MTHSIMSTLTPAKQQQVAMEVVELLKGKYGTSLNIEITKEDIIALASVSEATQEEIDAVNL